LSELVAVFLKKNGKDEFRFVPPCDDCGVLIHDLTRANVAVIQGSGSGKLFECGTHGGATVSRPNRRPRRDFLLGVRQEKEREYSVAQRRSRVPGPQRSRAAEARPALSKRLEATYGVRAMSARMEVITTVKTRESRFGGGGIEIWRLTGVRPGHLPQWFQRLRDRDYGGHLDFDWMDHVAADGETLLTEPYHLDGEEAREILSFADRHDLKVNFSATSFHYPTRTISIELTPRGER
jgi:hypothetical protein